ncbi:3624_t:CDS:1 [Ambispora gerdemannii]|uniref:3624_t:CDS:1 n=1 Tax=Ambispora gerdemannii TaxID=144530 RepID=A0A9N9AZZ6_9GLOM|nr:3624_t:CDS:1 [Ambispora gerdemannii]
MPKHCQKKNCNPTLFPTDLNKRFDTNEESILQEIKVPSPYDKSLVKILKKFGQLDDNNALSKKPPNSFILYRKAFQHTLINNSIRLSASEISRMASKKWKTESDSIKQEYKRIAGEIHESLPKYVSLPPSQKEPKSKYKWRIYSGLIKRKKGLSSNKNCELDMVNSKQNSSMSNSSVIDSQDSIPCLLANENVKNSEISIINIFQESFPSTTTEIIRQDFISFPLLNEDTTTYNNDSQSFVNSQQLIQSQLNIDRTNRLLNYERSVPSLSINNPVELPLAIEEANKLEIHNIDIFQEFFPLTSEEIEYQEMMNFLLDDKNFMTIDSDKQFFVNPQQPHFINLDFYT